MVEIQSKNQFLGTFLGVFGLHLLTPYELRPNFFFYQGFLHRHWRFTGLQGGEGPSFIPLYHFHPLTNIETFICNFACEMTITYF